MEALNSAPKLIDRALASGVTASYVLMDSWFTFAPLIQEITQRGLDVIGMVKPTNQRYLHNSRKLSLQELYKVATPVQGKGKGILRSIRTQMVPGIPIVMVFVRLKFIIDCFFINLFSQYTILLIYSTIQKGKMLKVKSHEYFSLYCTFTLLHDMHPYQEVRVSIGDNNEPSSLTNHTA